MHPQDPAAAIKALEGCEFGYVYLEPTDKLGADVPNPKSHICYGFATHVVILDDDGRVSEVYAAHDSGKVVNPISIQGQIEGGVLMGMGYALTEDWPLKDCVPPGKVRYARVVPCPPRFRISTPSTWRRTSCCPWKMYQKVKYIVRKCEKEYYIQLWEKDDWEQEGQLTLFELYQKKS